MNDDTREALETELDDLDIPMVPVDAILEVCGDAFDIDPKVLIQSVSTDTHTHPETPHTDALRAAHGAREVNLMIDLLMEGIESSTQMPHIARSIDINRALRDA